MKVVYIAGPYGASGLYDNISKNIADARATARHLGHHNIGFFCPHSHTAHFEVYGIDESFFQELDDVILLRSDAIFMLPEWEESKGARHEYELANPLMPVFFDFESVLEWKQQLEAIGKW